jgi:pimeloyl-ACP methyl ester carboxylesterase
VLHPARRERFQAPQAPPLRRVYYTAADGWRAPLFVAPAAPGGAGEPVVLAHTLAVGADSFQYLGSGLVKRLTAQGFRVYLLAHRGDRAALAPHRGALSDVTFDAILERDLPAALDAAAQDAGFPRVHWVGHGLGGLLGLAEAGRGGDRLASVIALCAAMRVGRGSSQLRTTARVLRWLPRGWRVPVRSVAGLGAALVDFDPALPGPAMRAAMGRTAEDVPVSLLRQLERWARTGVVSSCGGLIDYQHTLRRARQPLLLGCAECDPWQPASATESLLTHWGGQDTTVLRLAGLGHFDAIVGEAADRKVFQPLVNWLSDRRMAAWERDGEPIGGSALPVALESS